MKKSILVLTLVISLVFSGLALTANAAIDLPEEAVFTNVALGKEVTFRSMTDFRQALTMYNYFPDGNGIDGTGCYEFKGNLMTDGEGTDWMGYKVNSTFANVQGWAFLDLGEEMQINKIKLHLLAAWCFQNFIIQVSNDPNFQTGVTTLFSTVDSLSIDDQVVYNGGKIVDKCGNATGFNGFSGIDSNMAAGNIFQFETLKCRYVRITNTNKGNGGADNNTNFAEIEVYGLTEGILPPSASAKSGAYEVLESVELSTVHKDAAIYYTLDGSYPTPQNATLYTGPIDLSGYSGSFVLRAITVVDGKQSLAADYQYKVATIAKNVAYGKVVTFRSMTDFSQTLDMYNYFPDSNGIDGTGCYEFSGNHMTDGEADNWMGFKVNSTYANVQGWAFLDLGMEMQINKIKVHLLASWCFQNFIIQVSNDSDFEEGVVTLFSTVESLEIDGQTVYSGGKITDKCGTATGYNGFAGIDSNMKAGNIFEFEPVTCRYVRITNSNKDNGGADNNTNFTEIEVYNVGMDPNTLEDAPVMNAVKNIILNITKNTYVYTTSIGTVLNDLPQKGWLVDLDGNEYEVALTWSCEGYNARPAQDTVFKFTADYIMPQGLSDSFGVATFTANITVKAKVDTTALQQLVAQAESLNEEDYTTSSYAALESALNAARHGIDNELITEQEVNTLTNALNAALDGLVERAKDKSALANAISTAQALNLNDYTTSSYSALETAINAAKAVNEDRDATQSQVDCAISDLNSAVSALVERGDKSKLRELVDEIVEEEYREEDFLLPGFAAFEDAFEYALEILEKDDAETSKKEVQKAYDDLSEALAGLVRVGDKTDLLALINECEDLNEEDYSASSWAALQQAITSARAVANTSAEQQAYDEAKDALDEAVFNLVDLRGLKQAIETALTIEKGNYTDLSYENLRSYIQTAQNVLQNPDVTKETVNSTKQQLEQLIEALEEKPASTQQPSEEKKGCKTSIGFGAAALFSLLLSVVFIKRRT